MSIPVGTAVHTGVAFVGATGLGTTVDDFTALGDAVSSSIESAVRFAFANAKSIGTSCPSDQPLASATGWLPVASALAPAR
jgi:hypothetical protein